MTQQELEQKRLQLVLQRSSLKDQIEQIEDGLRQIGFALSVLKANEPAPVPNPE